MALNGQHFQARDTRKRWWYLFFSPPFLWHYLSDCIPKWGRLMLIQSFSCKCAFMYQSTHTGVCMYDMPKRYEGHEGVTIHPLPIPFPWRPLQSYDNRYRWWVRDACTMPCSSIYMYIPPADDTRHWEVHWHWNRSPIPDTWTVPIRHIDQNQHGLVLFLPFC